MTPQEKHLRIALSVAKYQFNELDVAYGKESDLPYRGAEAAEKAMQEADLMGGKPNESDRKFLAVQKEFHLNVEHIPTVDGSYNKECAECWKLSKLEQAWE